MLVLVAVVFLPCYISCLSDSSSSNSSSYSSSIYYSSNSSGGGGSYHYYICNKISFTLAPTT